MARAVALQRLNACSTTVSTTVGRGFETFFPCQTIHLFDGWFFICFIAHTTSDYFRRYVNMIEQDTVKLLRECDAGVHMGISSIDDVMPHVSSTKMLKCLSACREQHDALAKEIEKALDRFHDDGKSPNPMAKAMSWVKTNVSLMMNESDKVIADLMTDGCNMGVKSLNRYLNQYKAADEVSKDITKRLIHLEQTLTSDIRDYL